MSLGERIKALRRRAGLSQEQVAEQVGVSRQAVAKWEAGHSAPSTENLRKLAQVLQVGLEELAGEPAAACGPDQTGLGRSIRTCLQSALSVAGAYLLLFILGITAWEFRTLPDWMLEWRFVFGVLVNVPFQVPVPVYGWCAGLAVLLALLGLRWTVWTSFLAFGLGILLGGWFGDDPSAAGPGGDIQGWMIWAGMFLVGLVCGAVGDVLARRGMALRSRAGWRWALISLTAVLAVGPLIWIFYWTF